MFLFVGVSLFFVSVVCDSEWSTRIQRWKRSEPKLSRYTIVVLSVSLIPAFFSLNLFGFFAAAAVPICVHYRQTTWLTLVYVLAAKCSCRFFHHGKAFILFQTFKTCALFFLAIFPFVYFRYMNERQIGRLCLHKAQPRTQQKKRQHALLRHRPDYLFFALTFIYLRVLLYDTNPDILLFIRTRTHILRMHYIIVLAIMRELSVKSTRLMEI